MLAPCASDESVIIRQIGNLDGSKNEVFTSPPDSDFMCDSLPGPHGTAGDFLVNSTADDKFPGEFRSSIASTGDVRYNYSRNSVTIRFAVGDYYTNAIHQYTRMGGRVDWV